MEILNKKINELKYWEYALLAISIVYLLVEFNLNSQILNAIDTPELAIELEGWGRLVASFGAMLLTARFTINNKASTFFAYVVIAGISAFFMQKAILDYAVENTTDTKRKAAQHLVLLQSSLLSNVAELPDLNKEISDDEVNYKAFTAMLAFTSWDNADHLAVVKQHMPEVLSYQVEKGVNEKLPEQYDDFVHTMETKLVDYYKGIKGKRRKLEQGIEKLVALKHNDINQFFERMRFCGESSKCQKSYEHFYRKSIIEHLGTYLPWQELCNQIDYNDMVSTSSGLRSVPKKSLECTGISAVELESRLKKAVGLTENEKEITFREFVKSALVQKVLRDALNITDKEQFVDPSMSYNEFVNLVRGNAQKMAVNQELEKIELPVQQLDDKGRNYVKAVLVVPLALTFSLIFSILNFTSLAGSYAKKYHKHATPIIGVFLLLTALFIAPSNGIVSGGSGFLLEFVIGAENLIYPIGNIFN